MGVSFHAVMAKAFSLSLQITRSNMCAIATVFSHIYAPCLLNLMHLHRHWIVARFRLGVQANSPVRPANTGTGAFRGRSYRVNQ
uniref:Uncharacterized protein n=1 Tax=Arundo donax TaxID=35708 RepID=A0A0A8XN45_ARUDO